MLHKVRKWGLPNRNFELKKPLGRKVKCLHGTTRSPVALDLNTKTVQVVVFDVLQTAICAEQKDIHKRECFACHAFIGLVSANTGNWIQIQTVEPTLVRFRWFNKQCGSTWNFEAGERKTKELVQPKQTGKFQKNSQPSGYTKKAGTKAPNEKLANDDGATDQSVQFGTGSESKYTNTVNG